ncbi:Tyrosine aminotransferase [Porphyridium purpureum]|uniref:Tyrosine aminotransferase n=1 Tax=Porphyridium purpureum TaxID=35688 RepID=A0A5J4YU64_PORPP|nr:Tyrosine aminotransferase [Porphyridium purpureum]|eukprot:POR6594..scf229_5
MAGDSGCAWAVAPAARAPRAVRSRSLVCWTTAGRDGDAAAHGDQHSDEHAAGAQERRASPPQNPEAVPKVKPQRRGRPKAADKNSELKADSGPDSGPAINPNESRRRRWRASAQVGGTIRSLRERAPVDTDSAESLASAPSEDEQDAQTSGEDVRRVPDKASADASVLAETGRAEPGMDRERISIALTSLPISERALRPPAVPQSLEDEMLTRIRKGTDATKQAGSNQADDLGDDPYAVVPPPPPPPPPTPPPPPPPPLSTTPKSERGTPVRGAQSSSLSSQTEENKDNSERIQPTVFDDPVLQSERAFLDKRFRPTGDRQGASSADEALGFIASSFASNEEKPVSQLVDEVELRRRRNRTGAPGDDTFRTQAGFLSLDDQAKKALMAMADSFVQKERIVSTGGDSGTVEDSLALENFSRAVQNKSSDAQRIPCPVCRSLVPRDEIDRHAGMHCEVCELERRQNLMPGILGRARAADLLVPTRSDASETGQPVRRDSRTPIDRFESSTRRFIRRITFERAAQRASSALQKVDLSGQLRSFQATELCTSLSAKVLGLMAERSSAAMVGAMVGTLDADEQDRAAQVCKRALAEWYSELGKRTGTALHVHLTSSDQAALYLILGALRAAHADSRSPSGNKPGVRALRPAILLPNPCRESVRHTAESMGFEIKRYTVNPHAACSVDMAEIRALMNERFVAILIASIDANAHGAAWIESNALSLSYLAASMSIPVIIDDYASGLLSADSKRSEREPANGAARGTSGHTPAWCTGALSVDWKVPVLVFGSADLTLGLPGWGTGWLVCMDPSSDTADDGGNQFGGTVTTSELVQRLRAASESFFPLEMSPFVLSALAVAVETLSFGVLHSALQHNYETARKRLAPLVDSLEMVHAPQHGVTSLMFRVRKARGFNRMDEGNGNRSADKETTIVRNDVARPQEWSSSPGWAFSQQLYEAKKVLVLPAVLRYEAQQHAPVAGVPGPYGGRPDVRDMVCVSLLADTDAFEEACSRIEAFVAEEW